MQIDKEEKVEDKEVPKEGMEIEVSAPSQDQEMRLNTDPENVKETEASNQDPQAEFKRCLQAVTDKKWGTLFQVR